MSDNSSNNKFTVRLEMKSDWHIGTGAGIPGSVDALLARDSDSFPCVPAKTVVGIWRDALETLTYGLDGGVIKGKWQSWVDVILGSQPNVDKIPTDKPRPSILSIQPARLNENLRNAIGDDAQFKQALTFIKPNTRIDPASGTAETESLRFTEMGRIGTVLEAEFELDFEILKDVTEAHKERIWALLVASAGLVERIGGNRRRGSGKCLMQAVGEVSKDKAVEFLRNTTLGDNGSVPPAVAGGSVSNEDNADTAQNSTAPADASAEQIADKNETHKTSESIITSEWKKIEYSLTLHTPVAIVTNTLGNVSETLDFIPGTYLLPHITKQLKGISKYVASGDFQVLSATIEVEGARGLPVPKVIHYDKVDGGFDKEKLNQEENKLKPTVYNRLQESIEGGEQKKNYREGYVNSLDDNNQQLPSYETTKKFLLMHNTVRDDIQRPDETVGGVFSRQAIKAGTTLRGEIRFHKSIEDKVTSLENYESDVRLGTSKKDDYGLAELKMEVLEAVPLPPSADKELIVYLASDALLRNGNLRQTNLVGDLKAYLKKQLGVSLTEKDSLIQVRRIESWHEGWGFPRPTLTAMAAGSVVAFTIDDLTEDKKTAFQTALQSLELAGVGERRGEGYGQIRFNPPMLMIEINKDWKLAKGEDNNEKEEAVDELKAKALEKLKAEIKHAEKLKEFISIIELSALRDELARSVLKIANEPEQRKKIFGFEIEGKDDKKNSIPSLSQIGGLRSAIGRLKLDGSNKNVVTGWLEHLQATENRRKKWDSKDESGSDKLQKIKELINDENKAWLILCETKLDNLKVWNSPNELIKSGDNLRKELWAEAVKSLFDACARAHKRDTEDK